MKKMLPLSLPALAMIAITAGLWGCDGNNDGADKDKARAAAEATQFHPQINAAVFTGTLPCADCTGVETRLALNPDGSYDLQETYITNRSGQKSFLHHGHWVMVHGTAKDANTLIYQLDPTEANKRRSFMVEGDGTTLRLLAKDQQPMAGPAYLLTREKPDTPVVAGKTDS